MERHQSSPAKKQRVDHQSLQETAAAAHDWTGNAAVVSNVVRLLPTGQDVLRCELVSRGWRSSSMCPTLPPMRLTTQALNKTCPPCLSRNSQRLASVHAAFITETLDCNLKQRDEIRDANMAALEMLAASASNLTHLAIENIGPYLQDSVKGQLTCLTRLDLINSAAFSLPASLGTLTGLQHLTISKFTQLVSLAPAYGLSAGSRSWVQQLTRLTTLSVTLTNRFSCIDASLPASLQELDLDHNPVLEDLPEHLATLTDLRSLTVSGRVDQLPVGMGTLSQLSRLCFSKSDHLRQLPADLRQSASVKCVSVTCNTLSGDQHDILINTSPGYLQGGRGLEGMPSLTTLAISLLRCTYMLDGLTPTASLSCLTSLDIHHSPVLRSAGERGLEGYIAGLTALRCLQLSGITRVESIDSVAALTALTLLSIMGAEALTRLPDFEQLGLLQRLVLKGCSKVAALSGVQGLTSLERLTLQDMMSLGSLPAELGDLACLQEVVVYFCPCVRKFPASLQRLQLRLLSIGSLKERCSVARKMVASAKQRDVYRYPTDLGLAGGVGVAGFGMMGGAL